MSNSKENQSNLWGRKRIQYQKPEPINYNLNVQSVHLLRKEKYNQKLNKEMHNRLNLLDLHKKSSIDNFAELKKNHLNSSKRNINFLKKSISIGAVSRIDTSDFLDKTFTTNDQQINDCSIDANDCTRNILRNNSNNKHMSERFGSAMDITLDDIDKFSNKPSQIKNTMSVLKDQNEMKYSQKSTLLERNDSQKSKQSNTAFSNLKSIQDFNMRNDNSEIKIINLMNSVKQGKTYPQMKKLHRSLDTVSIKKNQCQDASSPSKQTTRAYWITYAGKIK